MNSITKYYNINPYYCYGYDERYDDNSFEVREDEIFDFCDVKLDNATDFKYFFQLEEAINYDITNFNHYSYDLVTFNYSLTDKKVYNIEYNYDLIQEKRINLDYLKRFLNYIFKWDIVHKDEKKIYNYHFLFGYSEVKEENRDDWVYGDLTLKGFNLYNMILTKEDKKCSNCGFENPKKHKYCVECGEKLD